MIYTNASNVSKKQMEEKMSSMNVTYELSGSSFEMFAPSDHVFKANELRSYLINELDLVNEPINKSEIYSWAMEILNGGLEFSPKEDD